MESDVPSWVEHEVILPEQYLAGARLDSPERRLCWAVLQEAVRCLQRLPQTDRRDTTRAEAWAWFCSDARSPFSFVDVCGWLDLVPQELRRRALDRVVLGHRALGRRRPGETLAAGGARALGTSMSGVP